MSVIDANGSPLHEGDLVRFGELLGIFRSWEDGGYEYVGNELTGQVVVETDGDDYRFPTFWIGGGHVAFDVESAVN